MTERLCMNCNDKPVNGNYDLKSQIGDFKGCMFFCTDNCRIEWNSKHPAEIIFLNPEEKITSKKYCPECNHLMKEFFDLEKGSYWKCANRKCEK